MFCTSGLQKPWALSDTNTSAATCDTDLTGGEAQPRPRSPACRPPHPVRLSRTDEGSGDADGLGARLPGRRRCGVGGAGRPGCPRSPPPSPPRGAGAVRSRQGAPKDWRRAAAGRGEARPLPSLPSPPPPPGDPSRFSERGRRSQSTRPTPGVHIARLFSVRGCLVLQSGRVSQGPGERVSARPGRSPRGAGPRRWWASCWKGSVGHGKCRFDRSPSAARSSPCGPGYV